MTAMFSLLLTLAAAAPGAVVAPPAQPSVPVLVRAIERGEPVTVNLRSGGLTIATSGRALASGGMGDLVRVVTATNRTLDATVEATGAVRIAVAP